MTTIAVHDGVLCWDSLVFSSIGAHEIVGDKVRPLGDSGYVGHAGNAIAPEILSNYFLEVLEHGPKQDQVKPPGDWSILIVDKSLCDLRCPPVSWKYRRMDSEDAPNWAYEKGSSFLGSGGSRLHMLLRAGFGLVQALIEVAKVDPYTDGPLYFLDIHTGVKTVVHPPNGKTWKI